MKLSKQQRAQVVELLRCAADREPISIIPCFRAADDLGLKHTVVHHAAVHVMSHVTGSPFDMQARLLEAAQRVEDGEWP